jgi:hypothetical protein
MKQNEGLEMEIKMAINFPLNTIVLTLFTMIASSAGAWFILSQGLKRIPIAEHQRATWRWTAAILLSAWLLVRLALAMYPPGDAPLANQFLITFISLGFGLAVGILPLLVSPLFRRILHAVSESWLIAPHAIRLAGFLFLALMDMKLLPPEFALSAGYGDFTTGLLALGMVYLFEKKKPYARALAIGWNALGLLDFISALITGAIYIVPFASQLASSGVSLNYLNYVLIVPSFGVPLYASLHIYSLFQMFTKRADEKKQDIEELAQAPAFQAERRSIHS